MFVELGAEIVGFKQKVSQEIAKTGKLRKVCQEKFAIQFAKKDNNRKEDQNGMCGFKLNFGRKTPKNHLRRADESKRGRRFFGTD